MKIVKLTAENVKRLTAVEISPEGNVITIGGKNGAGKSSVLDSIAYALGGQALVPEKPIRKGQTEAHATVELDNGITVTRKFRLLAKSCNCFTDPHEKLCDSLKPLSLGSSLTVQSSEGANFPTPQRMLDGLLGELSFDPLSFAHSSSKDKAILLRKLMNIDTSELENRHRSIYPERANLNKIIKDMESQERMMIAYKDAPDDELPLDEISSKMLEAEKKNREWADLQTHASTLLHTAIDQGRHCVKLKADLETAQKHLKGLEKALSSAKAERIQKTEASEEANKAVIKAEKQIPDSEKLKTRLAEIEKINWEVRENKKRDDVIAQRLRFVNKATEFSLELNKIKEEKEKLLAEAEFPIEGLGLDKDSVTFNDIPLDQASTAEQLRVSVAIGLALNPKLKVILIRDGSMLDSDSMRAIAKQAAEADAQLWLERVAESKDGVSVLIEDGSVAN